MSLVWLAMLARPTVPFEWCFRLAARPEDCVALRLIEREACQAKRVPLTLLRTVYAGQECRIARVCRNARTGAGGLSVPPIAQKRLKVPRRPDLELVGHCRSRPRRE